VINLFNRYKYKFYLNASHSIYIGDKLGNLHPHTWEITIDVKNYNKKFIQFNDIEKIVENVLEKYQNQNINEIEPFNKTNPTLEYICKYFNQVIKNELYQSNLNLDTIEICESPTRSFIIVNEDFEEINKENNNENNNNENNNNIIKDIISKYIDNKKIS
jgi:6-pyruvoyltetrahydropterin/6-carboxytetrahydropterin synthase